MTVDLTPVPAEDQERSEEQIGHHSTRCEVAPGVWAVARPLRDSSWWHRFKAERRCRRQFGHCWHPEGIVDWWCCECSAATDGWPAQRCTHCVSRVATP